MQVSVCLRQEKVLVTPQPAPESDPPATIHWITVGPGERLGGVPYATLRKLGDGQHDLPIDGDAFDQDPACDRAPARNAPRGWPVSGVVFLLLAVLAWGVFTWLVHFAESVGAHPTVIASYRWGGTMMVPTLLAGAGCLVLAGWMRRADRA